MFHFLNKSQTFAVFVLYWRIVFGLKNNNVILINPAIAKEIRAYANLSMLYLSTEYLISKNLNDITNKAIKEIIIQFIYLFMIIAFHSMTHFLILFQDFQVCRLS